MIPQSFFMAHRSLQMPMHYVPIYAILLFLSCSFISMHLCASSNRLVHGKPLSPGSTIVSDDGTFALGFFSPSNSTIKQYYVGIWYNNIWQHTATPITAVWVANRAAPIIDLSSAMLALSNSSNLVLSDGNGRVLWRSNNSIITSSSLAPTISAETILDNTGNFILRSLGSSTILWQSFDHPTDTLLHGMNLRISHKMHPLQHLVSWKSLQDPSPGPFSYSADPNNFLQRFIWNSTRPHCRNPVWTSYFLLGSYVGNLHSTIYMAVHRGTDDEMYMSFGMPVDSLSSVIRMEIKLLRQGKYTKLGQQHVCMDSLVHRACA
uniref:non-specific serine/threonine protein kinase n=1 Tax=Arundo donax TaxID=35708 RepID=A0A0A9R8L3_ARUDO